MKRASARRVVVVGADPSALTLACELALAGVPCRLLEPAPAPSDDAAVVGLHARTMDLFDLRGQADRFAAYGRLTARIRLRPGRRAGRGSAAARHPYLNVMPAGVTEQILRLRARELGVEVIGDARVVGLSQDETGVTLQVRGGGRRWEERASYVVGCDSDGAVSRLLGVRFETGYYPRPAILADVRFERPVADDILVHLNAGSMTMSIACEEGWHRVVCLADGDGSRSAAEPGFDELCAVFGRTAGPGLRPVAHRGLRRRRLRWRLAERYRVGRVLLAGDAAHEHLPVPGLGVNLGIQDALTLGWKLAAVVNGWAPPGLLDLYERERRTVAERDIAGVAEAVRLVTSAVPAADEAVESAACRLLGLAQAQASGLGDAGDGYEAAAADPLAGHWAPDIELIQPEGSVVRLYELLREARFLMVDLSPDASQAIAARRWSDRVRAVVADAADLRWFPGVTALLVRPDGYVAWSTRAAGRKLRAAPCEQALLRWCGPAPCAAARPANGLGG